MMQSMLTLLYGWNETGREKNLALLTLTAIVVDSSSYSGLVDRLHGRMVRRRKLKSLRVRRNI